MPAALSRPFFFVGNHLALDFVNTELVAGGERTDLLRSDRDVLRWARGAGLVPGASGPEGRLRLDRRVPALRAALRSLLEARLAGGRPDAGALGVLNRWLTRPRRPAPLLERGGAYRRTPSSPASVPEVLLAVADAAAGLLAGDESGALRRCANGHCILLFLDRSRAGRRRWCSMGICGNRAKVAAYHRRAQRRGAGRLDRRPRGSSSA